VNKINCSSPMDTMMVLKSPEVSSIPQLISQKNLQRSGQEKKNEKRKRKKQKKEKRKRKKKKKKELTLNPRGEVSFCPILLDKCGVNIFQVPVALEGESADQGSLISPKSSHRPLQLVGIILSHILLAIAHSDTKSLSAPAPQQWLLCLFFTNDTPKADQVDFHIFHFFQN